jgi:hypothetical protein
MSARVPLRLTALAYVGALLLGINGLQTWARRRVAP